MGTDEYEALGAGLHVVDDPDPLKRAGHLAASMRADLCATLPQVGAAIEARAAVATVGPGELEELRRLAARLASAQRIVDGTHARAVEDVAERLSSRGAAVAVHPTTIRDRAAAVESARERLTSAERALAAHDAEAVEPSDPAPRGAPDAEAEMAPAHAAIEPRGPRRARWVLAVGVITLALGSGLVLMALDLAPLWAAPIPALLACLWALRHLRPRGDDDADRAETSTLLREVALSTDEAFGARRGSATLYQIRFELEARRNLEEEGVRVAERAWHDLAGAGVDVAAVEDVVRRFDPQHLDALSTAEETVSVRAATALLAQLRGRWEAMWGDPATAPPAADAEAEAARVADLMTRPVVVVGPAIERAKELASVAPGAPVIVLGGPLDD